MSSQVTSQRYFEVANGFINVPTRAGYDWHVPFDRDWFLSQANGWVQNQSLSKPISQGRARFIAMGTLLKGTLFIVADLVRLAYAKITNQYTNLYLARNHLRAQWHGICLSGTALISPENGRRKYIQYWAGSESNRHPVEVDRSSFFVNDLFE